MFGPDAFKGLEYFLYLPFVLAPLAIWKLIDIAIWLYQHVEISWQ